MAAFLAAWLCLGLSAAVLHAAEGVAANPLVIRSWETAAGLPQNTVNAIVQTRDGYLWLATRDGLARFDGVRFRTFGLADGLPSVDVSSLFEDRNGVLWIGTLGGGLSRLAKGTVERVIEGGEQRAGESVTSIAEDRSGRLWVGTASGLSVYRNGQRLRESGFEVFGDVPIRALLGSQRGSVWVATGNGLFEHQNGQVVARPGPPGYERVVAYCLLEDRQGRLWASIGNGILLRWEEGTWHIFDQRQGVPFAYVTCLAEDQRGTLWAGSLDSGLYYFNGQEFVAVRRQQGLSADDIRSLRSDREGNLWVGTRTGGLNRLSRSKVIHIGAAQGLTNDFTRSVAESPDGALWVGTIGGGLYRGGLQGFEAFAPVPVAQFYAAVESVLCSSDNSIWWGGARSLLRWKEGQLAGCYTNEPWVRSGAVTALCEERPGSLWVGTSEGRVARFDGSQFREITQRLARGPVTALVWQTNQGLWVGSIAGGLQRFRPESLEVHSLTNGLLSKSIRALYLDRNATLWIGTAGGGLGRWRDGRTVSFTSKQGLGADTISQIVEDDLGHLWLGSSRGIVRVSIADLDNLAAGRIGFLHPHALGEDDGMPTEECSFGFCPSGLKTRDGLVCFSTVQGLVLVDPRRQGPEGPVPQVLVEELLVNGQPHSSSADSESHASAAWETRLVVPARGRQIELHYTAINFTSPEKIRFRYRLEGLDRDWVEAGTRRSVLYHRVPAGDFVFRVTACGSDGRWNEQGASLALTVRPYLWERRWFPFVAGLLAFVGFGATLRYAERRKYQRHLSVLKTQHAVERERLRIAQDMHDHIGGMLTQVSQISDLGQSESSPGSVVLSRFERIGQQARATVQAMDEIIWATNPKNDNLPRFVEYVSRVADESFEFSTIRCWQELPPDLPPTPLPADVRHNLFLAIREALHNVLKHSAGSTVWLRLNLQGDVLTVEVEDDGAGFDPQSLPAVGNGLQNMPARLKEIGGKCVVASEKGKGTKIRFELPLPQSP
jgi:ligand-binding sensor domain-containing protein/signal transduction histidine kinase